jgi:hypothetical protein
MMRRYAIGLAVILAIPLCMGQSCSTSFLDAVVDSINDDDTDNTDDDTDTTTDKGVPAGSYSGTETMTESLDNVNDAYAAETRTSSGAQTYVFDDVGRLVWSDGTPIIIGDTVYTSTLHGDVAEVVTAIGVGTNLTQYTTQATMTADLNGLTYTFSGAGAHTFRLTAGKVLYEGSILLDSDTVGGAAYELIVERSASLTADE